MSNCISLRMAIFRAFTVLTSFYEITAWTRTHSFAGRCVIAAQYDNCCVSGAFCVPVCPTGIKFRIREFSATTARRGYLRGVSRRENFRTPERSIAKILQQATLQITESRNFRNPIPGASSRVKKRYRK